MDYIAIVNIKQYIHDMYLCVYLYFFITGLYLLEDTVFAI